MNPHAPRLSSKFFNSFHVLLPFLYPLKKLDSQQFSDGFRRYRNGILKGNELMKENFVQNLFHPAWITRFVTGIRQKRA